MLLFLYVTCTCYFIIMKLLVKYFTVMSVLFYLFTFLYIYRKSIFNLSLKSLMILEMARRSHLRQGELKLHLRRESRFFY